VAFRQHLPLDLSFDHRIVDGADAARFLGTVADHLTNPWPLLPESVRTVRTEAGSDEIPSTHEGDGDVTLPNAEPSPERTAGYRERCLRGRSSGPSMSPKISAAPAVRRHRSICSSARCRPVFPRVSIPGAKARRAPDSVTVDVKGSPGEGPLESIDVTVSLDADADDETLDGIVTRGERTCYVERGAEKMLTCP